MNEKKVIGEVFPKVSVCIVTYNQKDYIRQCLQSIVEQNTNFEYEVIVGDDFSTDGTREVIREFKAKYPKIIKPIYHDRNRGAALNLISVINEAIGEYIAHCDGDDYWFEDKLQTQIDYLDSNEAVEGVFTNAKTDSGLANPKKNIALNYCDLLGRIFTRSPLIRSSLVERKKNINRLIEYISIHSKVYDFEMYYLTFGMGAIYVMGSPFVYYRNNPSGMSKNPQILEEYGHSIKRLTKIGLPTSISKAMTFDLKLIKYLKNYDPSFRVMPAEYVRSGRLNLFELLKLTLPSNVAANIRKHIRG